MWFKRYIEKCTLSHVQYSSWCHRFGKSEVGSKYKSLIISRMEHNFFYEAKEIRSLCFNLHILKNYHFVAEVTFNSFAVRVYLRLILTALYWFWAHHNFCAQNKFKHKLIADFIGNILFVFPKHKSSITSSHQHQPDSCFFCGHVL